MVYNSLTCQKEEFKPNNPHEVLVYVCGPTVYDSPHLGHAKSAVAFDLIRRYLKFRGYNVKLVKNYTDIDDKIIKRANERGINFNQLSEYYIKEYIEIMDLLNIEEDYKNPRATEVIDYMIEMIQGLIDKGHAYESNGSVYFKVDSFPKYWGLFWNVSEEELKKFIEERESDTRDEERRYGLTHEGAHTSEIEEKFNPKDFALWKKSKENEPYWESPWGNGRPGWHIECSAMALKFLGETIDIHGGGQDLKSPHHQNEIAQSEAYTGKPFANYFMHNGFVNIDNEKMSKSLGNFFLVSDVAKAYEPMVIRLFLISSQYRKSLNYSLENIEQAKKNYEKLINTIQKINDSPTVEKESEKNNELIKRIDSAKKNIISAMDDDFNTPVALAEIMSLFRELNRAIIEEKTEINHNFKENIFDFITYIDKIFGILPQLKKLMEGGLTSVANEEDENIIKELLEIFKETRAKLRAQKLYDISDYIREKLQELGIKIEDK